MCNYAQSPDLPLEVTLEKDLSCVLRISTIRAWIKVLKPFFFFFSGTTDVSGSLMKLMDSLKNPIEFVGLQNLETFTLKYSH